MSSLDSICEKLVKLRNFVGDGKVDGSVAHFNNQTSEDIWVDLVRKLELLALTNKLRLGNGSLKTGKGLFVEGISRGNGGLDQTVMRVRQSLKLLDNRANETESVVLSQNIKEVTGGPVDVGGFSDGLNELLLVLGRQGWVLDNGVKFLVLLDQVLESGERFFSGFNAGVLDRGTVKSGGIRAVQAEQLNWWLDAVGGRAGKSTDGLTKCSGSQKHYVSSIVDVGEGKKCVLSWGVL